MRRGGLCFQPPAPPGLPPPQDALQWGPLRVTEVWPLRKLRRVPAGEYLTAQMVAGSVIIAAVDDTPEKMAVNYRLYVEIGLTLYDHLQSSS